MNPHPPSKSTLEDIKVNIKIKLSALWAALMFVYVYVDILGFYKPGTIDKILVGKVWELNISQAWAISALILMAIPSFMIFLSLILKPKINRWLNLAIASFYILVSIANPIGETWVFLWIGAILEVLLLVFIVWSAWFWPKHRPASA